MTGEVAMRVGDDCAPVLEVDRSHNSAAGGTDECCVGEDGIDSEEVLMTLPAAVQHDCDCSYHCRYAPGGIEDAMTPLRTRAREAGHHDR